MNLILKVRKERRIKRIPPPLEPLPFHLIPKKLIDDLKIQPPLVAKMTQHGNKKKKVSMSKSGTRMNPAAMFA